MEAKATLDDILPATRRFLLAKSVRLFLNSKTVLGVMPNGPISPADGTLASRVGVLRFDYTQNTKPPTNLIARMECPNVLNVLTAEPEEWIQLNKLQQRVSVLIHATEPSPEATNFANAYKLPQGVVVPLDLLAEIATLDRSPQCALYALVEQYKVLCPDASAADEQLCLKSLVGAFVKTVTDMWGSASESEVADTIAKGIFLWAMLSEEHGDAFTVSKGKAGNDTCTPLRGDFGLVIKAADGTFVKASGEGKASNQLDKDHPICIRDSSIWNCSWFLAVFRLTQHVTTAEALCKCIMRGDFSVLVNPRQFMLALEGYNFVKEQARQEDERRKKDAALDTSRVVPKEFKVTILRSTVVGTHLTNGRLQCGAAARTQVECDGGGIQVGNDMNEREAKSRKGSRFAQQPTRDVSLLGLFRFHVIVNGAPPVAAPPTEVGAVVPAATPRPALDLEHSEAPSASAGVHTSLCSGVHFYEPSSFCQLQQSSF